MCTHNCKPTFAAPCAYNGILLSHKKLWNIVICDSMDGSWEYHTKWNKSDGKGQKPYDFIHMWDIKQKATSKISDVNNSMVVAREKKGVWGVWRG